MARYAYQGKFVDGNGTIVVSGTISVFLAGGSTAASIYVASSGGSAVNSVSSDSTNGTFLFYVDESDYVSTQQFKLTVSKTDFTPVSYDDIVIFPEVTASNTVTFTNKTLTSPTINTPVVSVNDDEFTVQDDGDATKKVQLQLSGVTTGNTRILTVPDSNATLIGKDTTETQTNKTFTTPTIADLTNMTHTHVSNAQGGELVGMTVKTAHTQTGAVATGTTTLPQDDTIPQNTEGDEYMTLAITPTDSTNKLAIEVVWFGASSDATSGIIAVALFQDSTANALAVGFASREVAANKHANVAFKHEMTAGTTSSTTFKIRAGLHNAGTTTFNGTSGSREYGGVIASSIRITEVQT